jgi:hypothetical protein
MALWVTARFGGTVDRETPSNATLSATGSFSPYEAIALEELADEEKWEVYESVYRNDW